MYACQDANFNLTAITDTSGTVVERYVFDPYGNRTIYNGSWAAESTSSYTWFIGHQGLISDVESRLIDNRRRMANSALGFSQREPSGWRYVAGSNLYTLVNDNPLANVDPWGLSWYSLSPVSYTHLDVYKRQSMDWSAV